jgi:hypothetical protein
LVEVKKESTHFTSCPPAACDGPQRSKEGWRERRKEGRKERKIGRRGKRKKQSKKEGIKQRKKGTKELSHL